MSPLLHRYPIEFIVVHHSATPLTTSPESIARAHRLRFQWGLGYHHLIDRSGYPITGRKIQQVPAANRGYNSVSIALCGIGDNTDPANRWSEPCHATMALLVAFYARTFPNALVVGHRDLPGAATECPGLDVASWLLERGLPWVPSLRTNPLEVT